MKTLWFAAAIVSLSLLPSPIIPSARADSAVDLNIVAKSVTQIAGVRQNDIILLTSDPTNYPFLEDLAVQVRAAGAFPLIWVTSHSLNERLFTQVPEKYDSQPPLLSTALNKIISAQINVDYGGDFSYDFFARADQKRLAVQAKAAAPATQSFLKLNRRYIDVGNGIFPNAQNARLFGVSQTALTQVFWTAMNSDYSKVQANAMAIKAAIAGASTMRVTNPNGTDISFGVKGVRFIVSDGSISPNCKGVGCAAILPAGDVLFIPVQGSAHGKVVYDNTSWGKNMLKGFTANFVSGELVNMSSRSDISQVKAAYAAGGAGRDAFTFVDIGVNNNVRDIPNSAMTASFAGGSVSLGFGGDLGIGGSNLSPFGFFGTQPGCTVTVDEKTIINGGKLAVGG